MPLRDEDKKLWQQVMQGVKPLTTSTQVPLPPALPKTSSSYHIPLHTWDLHGMTLSEAYQRTIEQVSNKYFPSLTFITGKSGLMQQEFSHWLEKNPAVQRVESLPGGGAFRVYLKKK